MAWNKLVPYDKSGNMMSWADDSTGGYWSASEWRPAAQFQVSLTYVGCRRGRSATVFTFKDDAGHTYPMFLRDFETVVPEMVKGRVVGTFEPVKRGANYGIELVS